MGEKNSGKTTWSNFYKGIMAFEHIAYLTKEKNYPFSQFDEDTLIGLVDEWRDEVLKVFLAGGDLTIQKKFKDSKNIVSKIPIYITTNELPDFGADQKIVEDRLHIFRTKELPVNMRVPRLAKYVYSRYLLYLGC